MDLEYTVDTLPNGLKVAHRFVDCPDVSIRTHVANGSLEDPEGKSGLMHLVEHFMYRMQGVDIKAGIESLTGRGLNGVTSPENVTYSVRLPVERVGSYFDLWAPRILSNELDAKSFETERKVILQELAPAEAPGSLPQYAINLRRSNFFPGSPFSNSPAGDSATVKSITLEEAEHAKTTRMHASNTGFVIVGGISRSDALGLAQSYLGRFSPGEVAQRSISIHPLISGYEEKSFPGVPVNMLQRYFQTPPNSEVDYLLVGAALDYLADGTASPLLQDLREKRGLVYVAGSRPNTQGYFTQLKGLGMIGVERFERDSIPKITQSIDAHLQQMADGDINEARLATVRDAFATTFYEHRLESIGSQSQTIMNLAFNNRTYSVADQFQTMRDITSSDLANVTRKYLQGPAFTLVILNN